MTTLSEARTTRGLPAAAGTVPALAALSQPLLVSEPGAHAFLQRLCVIVAVAVLGLVAWSGFATVNEVSVARGTIVPARFERVVQHFEGGIVDQILVQPGDRVEAGAPLFVLDDGDTSEDLTVATRRRAGVEARIEALAALAENRAPDFSSFSSEIAADAGAVYRTSADALASQRQLIESQIGQARHMSTGYDAQLASLDDDLVFAEENFARIENLVEKGYATRALLAERRKAITDAQNQITIVREKQKAASEQLVEAQKRLASFLADAASQRAASLQELRTELAATSGNVSKSSRRHRRLTVTSPVRGIVKSLEVSTIGGVIAAGQPLATIVPTDEVLQADTKVPVSEIGYISVGSPVNVKITAFDFTRFGWVEGTVTRISPSAFAEDGEEPYYQVMITLDSDHLPEVPGARLVPGMVIEGDIITGEKTVLAYLLTPIRKALKSSFAER